MASPFSPRGKVACSRSQLISDEVDTDLGQASSQAGLFYLPPPHPTHFQPRQFAGGIKEVSGQCYFHCIPVNCQRCSLNCTQSVNQLLLLSSHLTHPNIRTGPADHLWPACSLLRLPHMHPTREPACLLRVTWFVPSPPGHRGSFMVLSSFN